MFPRPTVVILIVLVLTSTACHGPTSSPDNTPASFDYYLLNLSWAPEFCATLAGNAPSSECDPKRHFGFVVHGLWPENDDDFHPQDCAPARPVAEPTVERMLAIMPARGLIQHEWASHGTCTGLAPVYYFAAIEKAFRQVQIPPEYRALGQAIQASPAEVKQKFAAANHAPAADFRVSCSGAEFVGVEVCLTKDLQFRQCGPRLRDCRAQQVTVQPAP